MPLLDVTCYLLVLLPRQFFFYKTQCLFPECNHIRNIRRWLISIYRYSFILNSNRGYQRLLPKPENFANYEELHKYKIITFYFLFLLKNIFLKVGSKLDDVYIQMFLTYNS